MKRHNLGTVIRFEFTRTVLKPKFWLISLSVPLLIAVVVGLRASVGSSTMLRNSGSTRRDIQACTTPSATSPRRCSSCATSR